MHKNWEGAELAEDEERSSLTAKLHSEQEIEAEHKLHSKKNHRTVDQNGIEISFEWRFEEQNNHSSKKFIVIWYLF